VTVYKDESNSNYGTAIVGSVSGTSISFGSEAVYASSNVYYNNVTYDTTNDKVVIAYMDYSGSQYGKSAYRDSFRNKYKLWVGNYV
jgi:predicted GNAT superfamily acetyltransferase